MKTLRITSRFEFTISQVEIAEYCQQFGISYVSHGTGGGSNNYWLEVKFTGDDPSLPDIKAQLLQMVQNTLVDVALVS